MNYLFTAISSNRKTGPIPVITSPTQTCSAQCPFKTKGCYAASGALNIHWQRLSKGLSGVSWETLLSSIRKLRRGTLFRINQAGDFTPREGDKTGDSIDPKKFRELVEASAGKEAIVYTHKSVLDRQSPFAKENRELIKEAVAKGFTVNLSANNLAHADELLALGIAPVVSVVPIAQVVNCKTPNGARVVVCPASVRDNVSCSTCGLCARAKRDYVIAFPAHSSTKKYVDVIARGATIG